MNIKNNIKTALKYTWQNPILVVPFVIIFLIFAITIKFKINFVLLILFQLLFVAIFTGCCNMIKKTIDFENANSQANQVKKAVPLLEYFLLGIREYCIPIVLLTSLNSLILFPIASIIAWAGTALILLHVLHPILVLWGLGLLNAVICLPYIIMVAALFYTSKKPIKAFISAINFLRKNIRTTIIIIACTIAVFVISTIPLIAFTIVNLKLIDFTIVNTEVIGVNVISICFLVINSLFQILVSSYFITSLIMLIFLCYKQSVEQKSDAD